MRRVLREGGKGRKEERRKRKEKKGMGS